MMSGRRKMTTGMVVVSGICVLLAVGLIAGCAGSTAGSGAAPAREAAVPEADFAGTWKGPFSISMGGGDVVLTLERAGESYTGRAAVDFEGMVMEGSIYRQTFEGTGCSFWVSLDIYDVHMTGRIEEGHLRGEMEVFMESEMVETGSFVLKKD